MNKHDKQIEEIDARISELVEEKVRLIKAYKSGAIQILLESLEDKISNYNCGGYKVLCLINSIWRLNEVVLQVYSTCTLY